MSNEFIQKLADQSGYPREKVLDVGRKEFVRFRTRFYSASRCEGIHLQIKISNRNHLIFFLLQSEDDGVVVASLIWGNEECRAGLLILDASTWTELGRTEFQTSSPVPKCLHGYFTPSK